jgi:ParB family chromosome partitioning protein
LAASIQEHGILQPLIVSQDLINDQYILIAGERRLQAAKLAGLTVVPVIVRQVTDEEQLELPS